jgi:hypothetical protein
MGGCCAVKSFLLDAGHALDLWEERKDITCNSMFLCE